MTDYSVLKSGTDIRGRAIASDDAPAILTDKAVSDFARAFALWLIRRTGKQRLKLAVGRDSRLTGEGFAKTIFVALKNAGLEIFDCGLFSTPAAFLVTKFPSMLADGSIMITASHHPKDINGLKFFTADGGVNSAELDEIIQLANESAAPDTNSYSTVVHRDCLRLYCDTLTDAIRKGTGIFMPLKGMKIAVDAGHGAGGFFATRVLQPLGADVSPSQFLEPDGNFPAHAPNPENKEAMTSLKNRVLETGADLGVIFDADVDRCAVVASDGTEINRSSLIALAAAIVLPEHPGATIVTDSVTTEGLREFIESLGGVQERFRRGYRNVIDEAKRLCENGVDAPLAIESSGHAAFAEHYFLDDGAYFIVRILVELSKLRRQGGALTDFIEGLRSPLEEADIRLDFTGDDWREVAEKIVTRLTGVAERLLSVSPDNYEGVRAYVSHANGYFIVRTSVHDPVLPIYIESDKPGGVLSIARFLKSFLGGFRSLDCDPLDKFIEEYVMPDTAEDDDAESFDDEEATDDGEPTEDYAEQAEYDDVAEDESVAVDGDDVYTEMDFEDDGESVNDTDDFIRA